MRLALALGCARYLVKVKDQRRFAEGLQGFLYEVILYRFTRCFYSCRQAAGRFALLTHEEPDECMRPLLAKAKPAAVRQQRLALDVAQDQAVHQALARYSSEVLGEREGA